jgi:hypothetical protein
MKIVSDQATKKPAPKSQLTHHAMWFTVRVHPARTARKERAVGTEAAG